MGHRLLNTNRTWHLVHMLACKMVWKCSLLGGLPQTHTTCNILLPCSMKTPAHHEPASADHYLPRQSIYEPFHNGNLSMNLS